MQDRLLHILCLLLMSLVGVSSAASEDSLSLRLRPSHVALYTDVPEYVQVLSLNNSLINHNDHNMLFQSLADYYGHRAEWVEHTVLGMSLEQHWGEGEWFNSEGEVSARAMVRSRAWTHIVLQEYSTLPRMSPEGFRRSLKRWVNYIREYCPNPHAQIIVPMNYPYNTAGSDYEEHSARLYESYMEAAYECGVTLCPWVLAYDEAHSRSLSSFNALYSDERHPSNAATYMMVCMEYGLIYGVDPLEITWVPSNVYASSAPVMRSYAASALEKLPQVIDPAQRKVRYQVDVVDSLGNVVKDQLQEVIYDIDGSAVLDSAQVLSCDNTEGIRIIKASCDTLSAHATVQVLTPYFHDEQEDGVVINYPDSVACEDFHIMAVDSLTVLPQGWRIDSKCRFDGPDKYALASSQVQVDREMLVDEFYKRVSSCFITDSVTGERSLRLLAIGNSYTYDALAYLPQVLAKTDPDVTLKLGIVYLGKADLGVHQEYITAGNKAALSVWNGSSWYTITIGYEDIINRGWDYLMFQQRSIYSGDFRTIENPLRFLLSWSRNKGFSGKYAWLITHPLEDGNPKMVAVVDSYNNPIRSSDQMIEAEKDVARHVMAMEDSVGNKFFDVVLPCGIALQQARKTSLGDYANQLAYDDMGHLQQGIGSVVESCAAALALGGGFDFSPIGTPSWPYEPWAHGEIIGMDDDSQWLAWEVASSGFVNPEQERRRLGSWAFGDGQEITHLGGRIVADTINTVNLYACFHNDGYYDMSNLDVSYQLHVNHSHSDTCTVRLYYSHDGINWLPADDYLCAVVPPGIDETLLTLEGLLPVRIPHSNSLYLAWNMMATGTDTCLLPMEVSIGRVRVACHLPENFKSKYYVFVLDLTGWYDLYLHISGDEELLGPWPGSEPFTETVLGDISYKTFPLDSDGGHFFLTFNDGPDNHQYNEFDVYALHDYYLKLEDGVVKNMLQPTAEPEISQESGLKMDQGALLGEGRIVVFDLQGRIVKSGKSHIELHDLPSGIYVARDGAGHALKIRN